jgi:hypothetical protein
VQAVLRNWLSRRRRSSPLDATLKAESADDGYLFCLDINGFWEERTRHGNHNAESVVNSYVIEQIEPLAGSLSLLEYDRLEHKLNSLLGRPVSLPGRIRLLWARVRVHAQPDDIGDLLEARRHRVAARRADEEMRMRIDRIIAFRNCLRDDPTLALAQMLLETPDKVTPETLATMESIAERIAEYAPGANSVVIAQLLRDFTANLKPDAKIFIAERLCKVLVEFGGAEPAEQIRAIFQSGD